MSLRLHPRRIANELQRISTSRLSFEMVTFVSRRQTSFTFHIQTKVKEGAALSIQVTEVSLITRNHIWKKLVYLKVRIGRI